MWSLNHSLAASLNVRFDGRYRVESGNVVLILRFTSFDPSRHSSPFRYTKLTDTLTLSAPWGEP
jgi:hypothetical protein